MKRIEPRLEKLERQQALVPKNCSTCGFPGRGVRRVVVIRHTDSLPTCSACNQPLDTDGRPLFTGFKRIIRRSQTTPSCAAS
jgi:hypothetical protein